MTARPETADAAQRYFRALRQLRVGSLNLAHITKGEGNDKRPFGSTFWFNGARSVWFAQREESASRSNAIDIGLFDRNNNLGTKAVGPGATAGVRRAHPRDCRRRS